MTYDCSSQINTTWRFLVIVLHILATQSMAEGPVTWELLGNSRPQI